MRKQYAFILILIMSCITCSQMYSINCSNSESFSQRLGDDWDQLTMQGLHESSRPKFATASAGRMALPEASVKAYQNDSYIKLEIGLIENLNIQIINKFGITVYSQQDVPANSVILIDIIHWDNGDYKINVKNATGSFLSTSDFIIR